MHSSKAPFWVRDVTQCRPDPRELPPRMCGTSQRPGKFATPARISTRVGTADAGEQSCLGAARTRRRAVSLVPGGYVRGRS